MCNHLNLKIIIHIFTIIYLIMIIIIMRGENFMAHLGGLGGTPVCRGTQIAHHCVIWMTKECRSTEMTCKFKVDKRLIKPFILYSGPSISIINWFLKSVTDIEVTDNEQYTGMLYW
jgi:hypothetical protein